MKKLVEIKLTISDHADANITDAEAEKISALADDLACDFESRARQICKETFGSVGVLDRRNPGTQQDGRVEVAINKIDFWGSYGEW